MLEACLADFSVLHSDSLLCSTWAAVRNESTRKGRSISSADSRIAATALVLSAPLVTNNPKDYAIWTTFKRSSGAVQTDGERRLILDVEQDIQRKGHIHTSVKSATRANLDQAVNFSKEPRRRWQAVNLTSLLVPAEHPERA